MSELVLNDCCAGGGGCGGGGGGAGWIARYKDKYPIVARLAPSAYPWTEKQQAKL